jgi:tripartite-type tricarboxylate transporter receptor subunit TctC
MFGTNSADRSFIVAVLALGVALGASAAQSQTFPNQSVRVIVPISAGSVTDILARTVGEKLAENWRQQVTVENRPGVPGVASAAKSPADGQTLMLFSNGLTILGALNRSLSFDPIGDFSGVTKVGSVPFILIANPALPAKSVKELIALAKEKPGTINIAVPGRGTAASIASELFRREAGVNIVAVPYKGAPEAHTSVLRGDAHIFFSNLSAAAELIHSARCVRWRCRRGSGCRRSRTFRRWPKPACRTSSTTPGSACWCRPRPRARSSKRSIATFWRW